MKKPAIIALSALGIAVIGGGSAAVGYTLGADEPAEPVAAPTAEPTPAPTVTVTITPTPEPVEKTEAVAEPVETVEADPVDPFIEAATRELAGWGESLPEDEMWEAGYYVCDQLAAGQTMYDIEVLPQFGQAVGGSFIYAAMDYLC